MGILDVSKISEDDLRIYLARKTNEIGKYMGYYCDPVETEQKVREVKNRLIKLVISYFNGKVVLETMYDTTYLEDQALLRKEKEEDEKKLDALVNNDLEFIREFTRNGDDTGLEYTVGDKKLFSGINKAFEYSIIKVMQLQSAKDGKEFELPEELKKYEEMTPLRDIQIRDEVTLDMFDAFGPEIRAMFFRGEGERLYNMLNLSFGTSTETFKELEKIHLATEDDKDLISIDDYAKGKVVAFSDAVDESVYHNNENNYFRYSNLVSELKEFMKTSDFTLPSKKTL